MAFWDNVVNQLRRLFARRGRGGIPLPLPPPVQQILAKKYLITISGHVIYKPMKKRITFKRGGVATLDMFLAFAEAQGLEQGADRRGMGEHPLVLEMVAEWTGDREVTTKSLEYRYTLEALRDAIEDTEPSVKREIEPFMIWGVECTPTNEEQEFEAIKRLSHDGDYFQQEDITSYVKPRITSHI